MEVQGLQEPWPLGLKQRLVDFNVGLSMERILTLGVLIWNDCLIARPRQLRELVLSGLLLYCYSAQKNTFSQGSLKSLVCRQKAPKAIGSIIFGSECL